MHELVPRNSCLTFMVPLVYEGVVQYRLHEEGSQLPPGLYGRKSTVLAYIKHTLHFNQQFVS
jgi:hypothetical protein